MFEYAKHVLMTGEKSNVLATEITFWPVVETIFEKADLTPYLTCNRVLARIPCGMLNLNLTKEFKIALLIIVILFVFILILDLLPSLF